MKPKRGRKCIGKPKRRTKREKVKNTEVKSEASPMINDHTYSWNDPEHCKQTPPPTVASQSSLVLYKPEPKQQPPATVASTSSLDLLYPSCGYSGSFDSCECVVHTCCDDRSVADHLVLPDHHEAEEYYLVFGTDASQYQPEDNVDYLTLTRLRLDAVNHEAELNKLNFEILKTTEQLHLIQWYENRGIHLKLSVSINSNFNPSIQVHGKTLPFNHNIYDQHSQIYTIQDLMHLVAAVNELTVCFGNPDSDYRSLFSSKAAGSYLEEDCGATYTSTIRAASSKLLSQGVRCIPCRKQRAVYRVKVRRSSGKDKRTNDVNILSSSRPNCSLTREELEAKQKLLKAKTKELELENKRLRKKVQEVIQQQAVEMNASGDIDHLVNDCTADVEQHFEANSFQRIFWEEQMKYNKLKSKSAMRWHPLIVKWSLLLKSKSSKAYQTMKDSGFINLPSERTLYDYSHCVPSKMGFVPETIAMLISECKEKGLYTEPWKECVGILQDEIKIKSDLVYCPTTGELVGYIDLDNTSNQLHDLENGIMDKESQLATSALVLMVRGAATSLKFPLAAFSTSSLDATQLYTILWRAIEILEMEVGLKVLFISCDGAGQNRKFFEMHRDPQVHNPQEPINWCPNPYADDDRKLYFISDPPHLLKTTRNCFANSNSHKMSRHLWNNGNDISWLHIVNLYEQHIEGNLYVKSNLNRAHIDLTSFSQMKVNLAAQVLSARVAAHLELEYGPEVTGTVEFLRLMNKFFDCVNTRNLNEGRNKCNPDLNAYTDPEDERLQWLTGTFLEYFDSWKSSAESRQGRFTKDEINKMQLSQQTLDGLKISVRSIVECTRYLLAQGAPFVITEVFNQDILEQHFGHYRHKGGANDNPTIDNVRHTLTTLRVVGSSALAPLRGNTKRKKTHLDMDSLNRPLPRKKSRP